MSVASPLTHSFPKTLSLDVDHTRAPIWYPYGTLWIQ